MHELYARNGNFQFSENQTQTRLSLESVVFFLLLLSLAEFAQFLGLSAFSIQFKMTKSKHEFVSVQF